jgi:hypothetical protein
MPEENINVDSSFAGDSQNLFERVVCAEYLLAKGHLMSDLEQFPPQIAKNLVAEAHRFAIRKLSNLGLIERYQFGLSFSFN